MHPLLNPENASLPSCHINKTRKKKEIKKEKNEHKQVGKERGRWVATWTQKGKALCPQHRVFSPCRQTKTESDGGEFAWVRGRSLFFFFPSLPLVLMIRWYKMRSSKVSCWCWCPCLFLSSFTFRHFQFPHSNSVRSVLSFGCCQYQPNTNSQFQSKA